MCCICGGGSTGSSSSSGITILGSTVGYALGAFLITIELTGWILFYLGYKDSLEYARYLIDEQEENVIVENFSINTDFDF